MFNLFNQKALNRINSEEFYDNDQNACIFWFKNLNPIVVYGNKEHPSWKCVYLNALPYIQCKIQNINFYAREFMLIGKPEFIRAYYDAVVSIGIPDYFKRSLDGVAKGLLLDYLRYSYSFPLIPSPEDQYLEEMVYMLDEIHYIVMAGSHQRQLIHFIDSFGDLSLYAATDLINYLGGNDLYIDVVDHINSQDKNRGKDGK